MMRPVARVRQEQLDDEELLTGTSSRHHQDGRDSLSPSAPQAMKSRGRDLTAAESISESHVSLPSLPTFATGVVDELLPFARAKAGVARGEEGTGERHNVQAIVR